MRQDKEKWANKGQEDEKTIKDLAHHLSAAKLEIDSLKEQLNKKGQPGSWIQDEDVQHCTLCSKEFNLSRRKVFNIHLPY